MDKNEVLYKLHHWCDNCSKAYDFTCSGRDAKRCDELKDEFLRTAKQKMDKQESCVHPE